MFFVQTFIHCSLAMWLIASGFFQSGQVFPLAQEEQLNTITLQIKSSPEAELQTNLQIHSPQLAEAILDSKRIRIGSIPVTDRSMQLRREGKEYWLELDTRGNVYDRNSREQLQLTSDRQTELARYGELLSLQHYGKLLSWDAADQLLPVKKKFTVLELETGKSFQVQRRAGSDHADVQPLTKQDTAIMKQIYNGEWSWKRKAILVQSDEGWIAASMHGMPHGGDGIPGNQFAGHFCIHFLNSVTHKSNHKDPGHQLMVHKAAGEVETYLRGLNPFELVDSWIAAVHLQQIPFMGYFFRDEDDPDNQKWNSLVEDLRSIRSIRRAGHFPEPVSPSLWSDKKQLKVTVDTGIQKAGSRPVNRKLDFYLSLHNGFWVIDRVEGLGAESVRD